MNRDVSLLAAVRKRVPAESDTIELITLLELAADTRRSVRTISTALGELRDLGIITTARRPRGYRITVTRRSLKSESAV